MLHLDSVLLENYRCFKRLEVTFHENLTVLVAENGQGKTSVLDAIRVLLWPYVSAFDLAKGAFNDPANTITVDDARMISTGYRDMARQLPTKVSASGSIDGGRVEWFRFRDSEAPQTKTKDGIGTKRLKDYGRMLQDQTRDANAQYDSLPVLGYYGTGRLWDEKRLTERKKAKPSSQNDFFVRSTAYLDCLDPASSYKSFKEWFSRIYQSYLQYGLKHAQRGESFIVPVEISAPVLAVQHAIDEILKETTGWHTLEYDIEQKDLVLQHPTQGVIKFDLLSDGVRNMLAMVGDIAFRCIKLNPHLSVGAAKRTEGVVLIDEVDMHLHPVWQQQVLTQLQNAFPNIQFIVTTHSPQVLSTVGREHIRVLYQDDEGNYHASKPDFSPLAHESGDALARVMGTHKQPPLPLQEKVRVYETLVRSGQENTLACVQLKQELDVIGYQPLESELAAWRFLASYKKGQTNG